MTPSDLRQHQTAGSACFDIFIAWRESVARLVRIKVATENPQSCSAQAASWAPGTPTLLIAELLSNWYLYQFFDLQEFHPTVATRSCADGARLVC
jgi:hypothetical protein